MSITGERDGEPGGGRRRPASRSPTSRPASTDDRGARRARAPRPDRRRPVHRHGTARRAGRAAREHEHQLPRERQAAGALGQRASEHRAVPDVPDARRLDHRRGRQRRQFRKFVEAGGRPELADDERFATNPSRVRHRDTLVPILAEMVKARDKADWIGALEAAGVPCGPINDLDEVFDNEQVVARGMRCRCRTRAARTRSSCAIRSG